MLGVSCIALSLALQSATTRAVESVQQLSHGSMQRSFELTDQLGRRRSDKDFLGKWLLVYFGFTSCPNECPMSISELAQAIRLLGPDAAQLRVAFITVDPERDTPAVLSHYLANFGSGFTGLTGTKAQIARVLATFDAYAATRPNTGGGYTMEHSSSFYLMDPSGQFERRLSAENSAPNLAAILRKIVTAR